MPKSNNNEITVKAKCCYEKLDEELRNIGFKEMNKYDFTDIFLIPKEIDIKKETTREILKRAVLLREAKGITTDKSSKKITFKIKNIDNSGNIVSQSSIKCSIENIEDAKELFLAIGYKELMKIEELHIVYQRENLKLIVKENKNGNVLIEIETDEKYPNIEILKDEISKLDISIDTSNFFVKKAEEELEKIKNKG